MKRLFDCLVAVSVLCAMLPVLLPVLLLIWMQDGHSPFYIAPRIGRDGRLFRMIKLRSMRILADRNRVDSTAGDDPRITWVGRWVRRTKLDEVPQLINVLIGQMSLVGPRPNVGREVDLYTDIERGLLVVRPGITDWSSIVFSDEGEILRGRPDPDLAYNQLIRPWKSRLGLLYVARQNQWTDLRILLATVVAVWSRAAALRWVVAMVRRAGGEDALVSVAARKAELVPHPPPGADRIVEHR